MFKKIIYSHLTSRLSACFLLVLVSLGYSVSAADSESSKAYTGLWLTEDDETIVKISNCDNNSLCGRVVGFSHDEGSNTDTPITEEEKQMLNDLKMLCSTDLLGGLKEQGAYWGNGWVMDFDTEKKYSLKIALVKGVLKVRAYEGSELFGENYLWKRVEQTHVSCADILTITNAKATL